MFFSNAESGLSKQSLKTWDAHPLAGKFLGDLNRCKQKANKFLGRTFVSIRPRSRYKSWVLQMISWDAN